MVKEGMEHKLKSARHAGKSHALARESYNCKYDDMEEARHYHEGFKEGLAYKLSAEILLFYRFKHK